MKDIKLTKWKSISKKGREIILRRSQADIEKFIRKVKPIVERVREEGDRALLEYNKKFNGVDISAKKLLVTKDEILKAEQLLDGAVKKAIEYAYKNVKTYHSFFLPKKNAPFHEVTDGIFIADKITPIDSVGIYIPSGKGTFPSMTYMLGVPAQLAGVPRVVMVSPPNKNGEVDPACLYAAQLCGIHEIYKVGGAQSIAALTFGTKTIEPVNKIIGPGSGFITAAKKYVSSYVDIGPPAGPSESLILADGTTPAELAAYDLCIEAEHGEDSMAVLITHRTEYANQVVKYINKIISEAPSQQAKILHAVFSRYEAVILTENLEESISIANDIATEHLMIHSDSPAIILSQVTNAGEILLGHNSPFSLANYAAGANAVLPTGGMAKSYSSVSVSDFVKRSSIIKITKKGLYDLSPHVRTLANYEGFHFHEKALAIRTRKEKNDE